MKTLTPAAAPAPTPVFTDYKGVSVGMSAVDVRNKLDHLEEKGKLQNFFVFSDKESAQVFYDDQGQSKRPYFKRRERERSYK